MMSLRVSPSCSRFCAELEGGYFVRPAVELRLLRESPTVGVGSKDEQALASVAGPNVGRSNSDPLRIEPDRGKVSEHGVESQGNVPCDVLTDEVSGS